MNTNEKLLKIYEYANEFLLNYVSKDVLLKQLDHYYEFKPDSLELIFKQMISSLKNKQGYDNFIANIDLFKGILEDYNPKKVNQKYELNWELLFNDFKNQFNNNYKMDITNKRNAWVMYSKGVLSCSLFLNNFDSFSDFDNFVKSFFLNEFTIASLPMLLEKEIFGFGFPLACDFLKELGYVQYGKPDVHLKDIFYELKITNNKSDYEIFKKIVKIGIITKNDPVIVDKIFWLIGSGNFYESKIKIGRKKEEFIKYIKDKI
ncbi:hypothetical protein KAZ01_04070 [Candidatus Gracilibacteria bacterium]|nr:hypothetical protein [Candidatus Gracilibacteria bacterium]